MLHVLFIFTVGLVCFTIVLRVCVCLCIVMIVCAADVRSVLVFIDC